MNTIQRLSIRVSSDIGAIYSFITYVPRPPRIAIVMFSLCVCQRPQTAWDREMNTHAYPMTLRGVALFTLPFQLSCC